MPLYRYVVVKLLHPRLSAVNLAMAQGLVSALSELGAAFLFFIFVVTDLPVVHLLGFGAAAGAIEAIMLPFIKNPLRGTPVGDHATDVLEKSTGNPAVQWLAVLERLLAMVIHIASRALVFIGIQRIDVIPVFLAVITFGAVDGTGYFGYLKKWRFDEPRLLLRLYAFVGAIVLIQSVACVLYYYPG
jgi:hypothetical protein